MELLSTFFTHSWSFRTAVRNFAYEIHSHKQQKPASSEGSVSMLCTPLLVSYSNWSHAKLLGKMALYSSKFNLCMYKHIRQPLRLFLEADISTSMLQHHLALTRTTSAWSYSAQDHICTNLPF